MTSGTAADAWVMTRYTADCFPHKRRRYLWFVEVGIATNGINPDLRADPRSHKNLGSAAGTTSKSDGRRLRRRAGQPQKELTLQRRRVARIGLREEPPRKGAEPRRGGREGGRGGSCTSLAPWRQAGSAKIRVLRACARRCGGQRDDGRQEEGDCEPSRTVRPTCSPRREAPSTISGSSEHRVGRVGALQQFGPPTRQATQRPERTVFRPGCVLREPRACRCPALAAESL